MRSFTERALPLLTAVGLGVLGPALVGCGGTSAPPATATTTPSSPAATSEPTREGGEEGPEEGPEEGAGEGTPGGGSPAPATSGARPDPDEGQDHLVAGHYQPLWPFADSQQVTAWQRAHRANGTGAWHLDARRTALAFTRDHLGFTEIDQAVKTVVDGRHARVHVGYRSEEAGRPLVAAVVHLVRYGRGADAPWEVVGTDDTTFTLTRPAYGATAGSPLTVGGRITGVDESIRVRVLRPGSSAPVGERCCAPAGGENAAWSARVSYKAEPGRTLTVVASTGGHIAEVERFAVTGVRPPS